MNSGLRNLFLIGAGVVLAAGLGGYVARNFTTAGQPQKKSVEQQRRPIIQIVRQPAGLLSLADTIATLCPSIASIESAGATGSATVGFAVSADGWVVAGTSALPKREMQVRFGAGDAVEVSETRSDPVSGLSILKTAATGLTPVRLADQSFPRVGDFGFVILNPAGSGCSAQAVMVGSDFLADGGAPSAYIRLQPMGPDLPAGAPFISGAGEVVGVVAANGPANSAIPADVVADITDELLRGSLSPTTRFGFRAEDFDASLSGRLSNARSTGTAVAIVQPKTPAARAGLEAGDIVVAVNGSPVASASELGRALDGAGKTVSLDVARADDRLTFTIAKVPGS
ncbi:MAG TPA: S1C family serine protease [Sphingomicrobium sp.]